jgi:hypothetical protein
MRRESESKSLCSTWISDSLASVFTAVVIYFPIWNPTLIKYGSLVRESATHGDDWGIFSTRGRAESPPVGTLPVVPSPYD